MTFKHCYTVILSKPAGDNIGIITANEAGYNPTNLDWGTGEQAQELVRHANHVRGIKEATQLDYELKSMFFWSKK